MAVRKLTVSLPEDLAQELIRTVPARERSKYVANALKDRLHRTEREIVRACLLAQEDKDAQVIEREFDAIADPIEEPWDVPEKR
jgi:hypothetical protein